MSARLDVVYQDATVRIAVRDNVTFAVWFDAPTGEQMRTLDRIELSTRRKSSGGVGFVNVVVAGMPRFTEDVRTAAMRMVKRGEKNGLAAAHIVLLGGITGVGVRAFLTTTFLITRPGTPVKLFSDVGVASRWLIDKLGEGTSAWSEADMVGAIDALLARSPAPA